MTSGQLLALWPLAVWPFGRIVALCFRLAGIKCGRNPSDPLAGPPHPRGAVFWRAGFACLIWRPRNISGGAKGRPGRSAIAVAVVQESMARCGAKGAVERPCRSGSSPRRSTLDTTLAGKAARFFAAFCDSAIGSCAASSPPP